MKNDKINYLKILYQRRSTKMFSSKIVPDNKINLIVEAGNESPSSFGLQPWKFVVVSNKNKHFKDLSAISWNQPIDRNASHIILIFGLDEKAITENDYSFIKKRKFLNKYEKMKN